MPRQLEIEATVPQMPMLTPDADVDANSEIDAVEIWQATL